MPPFTLSFLVIVIILAVSLLVNVALHLKISQIRKKMKVLLHNSAEIGNFLNLFSQNISKMSEVNNWMNVTARYVADLVEAQSVCVFTADGDGFKAAGVSGPFPLLGKTDSYVLTKSKYVLQALRATTIIPGQGLLGKVAQGQDLLLIDDPKDPRLNIFTPMVPLECLMAVPMIREGSTIGIICAVNNKRPENGFSHEQIGRFKFIAGQVVLAENILRSYSILSERQRLNQELTFTRNLQRSMLPPELPRWGHFMVQAYSRSSKEVSGDFYDYVEIDEDRLLVVIGDASGKGIPACMIMAMTRSFIRANVARFTTLKQLLLDLNDNLYHDMGDGRYITLGICLLNRKENTLEYARAGHTELLVYVRNHIRSIYPDGAGLGVLPSDLAEFDTFCAEYSEGMKLLLFTDGINEAIDSDGMYFGQDRIKEIFMKSSQKNENPHQTITRLMDAVNTFSETTDSPADDQTVVIISQAPEEKMSHTAENLSAVCTDDR